MIRCLPGAAAAAVCALTGSAACASDPSATLDLTPVLQGVVAGVVPIVAALASAALLHLVTWLKARTGIEIGDDARTRIDQGLQRAIAFGSSRAHDAVARLGRDGALSADLKSAILRDASAYALTHLPDTLKLLGIDEARLAEMIEARLGQLALAQAKESAISPTPATRG